MYTPAFYISKYEPLTWSQQLHNVGAELLHFPFLHKDYDLIDVKTLERSRITPINHAGKLFELVIKVMLAATVVLPIICLAISYPSASKTSWNQIDTLFNQLDPEQKKDFLYTFLTKKEIEQDSPFTKLHLIAESYRKSGIEADLLSQLIGLDSFVFEEVKQWKEASETFYAEASIYVLQHDPKISVLYPFLSGVNQIRILQQLQNREKDLFKLFSLSTTAALENPGQLLNCIIPKELLPRDYETTLGGNLHSYFDWGLQKKIPKAHEAIEKLILTLPQASVLGIFWKTAKRIKHGIWTEEIRGRVTINNLSSEEKSAVKALSFEEVLALEKFKQPWIKLWYLAGQTPERLSTAYFSLSHDNENGIRQKENRENFLNFLSHKDLRDLINQDPEFIKLSKIFGEQTLKPLKEKEQIKIPYALLNWWSLYEKVDYKERFNELSTFCTNESFLLYFEAVHDKYLEEKPAQDRLEKELNEFYADVRKKVDENIKNFRAERKGYVKGAERAKTERAKTEKAQAEQTLHSHFKVALEYLGLNPKQSYTKEEIVREFRLWSRTNHPDKNKTEGATERFQKGNNYKDVLIELLANGSYSKTPIC